MSKLLGLLMIACGLFTVTAEAAPSYSPMAPLYVPPNQAAAERRVIQGERFRMERERTEDLRQLRNDLEDRDHRQKMEGFRERLRDQDR